jgi:carbohydrate-selective porin OprB
MDSPTSRPGDAPKEKNDADLFDGRYYSATSASGLKPSLGWARRVAAEADEASVRIGTWHQV